MPRLAKPAQGKYADFARSVRALREAAGLSVQDLSDESGVPPSSIYATESGTRLPTEENFTAMAPALGLDLDDAVELRRSAAHNAVPDETPYNASPVHPRALKTHADLAVYLHLLHVRAGAPALRTLGLKAGMSPASISRILRGRSHVSWHSLSSLLNALDANEREQAEVLSCWKRLQGERGSKPSSQTLALLYGTATSCAYPGCAVPLVERDGEQTRLAVEVVHIEPIATAPHSDQFDNLILLCPNHHRSRGEASPEDLRTWKADQADRAREAARLGGLLRDTTSSTPSIPAVDGALSPAFQAFYAQCADHYLAYTSLHLGPQADAEAVVHEVFARLHARWDRQLRMNDLNRRSFDILQSRVLDELRDTACDPSVTMSEPTAPSLSRELGLRNVERYKIAELSSEQYNVLVFRYLLVCTAEETARVMGLSQPAVRNHERSARRSLAAGSQRPATSLGAARDRTST